MSSLMPQIDNEKRCELILMQLECVRELTKTEFRIFTVMVSLNEQNFTSATTEQLMEKHQNALDYIIQNS